ncbi:hypothetical protein [Edaphobacter aggregans]|uniref:hypothetical protein n=1 Tax=Edaphobacter aggregans TaxID=570835 RepID=UPI000F74306C|nr:hypothetical protein [Edaphobacter aggregans]
MDFSAKNIGSTAASLGETDDRAHAGRYGFYLAAAHRVDQYLEELWKFVQADPEYRGHPTLIFLPGHGPW